MEDEFECSTCGAKRWHLMNVEQRYCDNHDFTVSTPWVQQLLPLESLS